MSISVSKYKKVSVLIVDDSVFFRTILSKIINDSLFLEVVGTCADPYEAREKIKQLNPDVITLDIEMPRMDGITFLKNVMRLRPLPVVMISTHTQRGAEITLKALELGAVDYIHKPKVDIDQKMMIMASDIVTKLRIAAKANVQILRQAPASMPTSYILPAQGKVLKEDIRLIVIGASTGGVEAIKRVLSQLPKHMPPIAIVQHMPKRFTHSYAKRLDNLLAATVVEFSGGNEALREDCIYIANGSEHLAVRSSGDKVFGYCLDSDPVNRHRPSVDVLFESAAKTLKGQSIGILLTGMGVDGASGLGSIKDQGAITVAQNESSSVVWGMPRVAIEQDAANYILDVDKIAPFLIERCYG